MNLRHYKGSLIVPVVLSALFAIATICMILWLLFGAVNAAVAADTNLPCMTKEQAKAKYPGAWLYWHGTSRCWDNQKGRSAAAYASRPAKPGRAAAGITVSPPLPASQGPSIAFPTLMAGGGTTDDMLQAGSMTSWPLIMDFDVEPPQFIPWQKRIAAAF